MGEQTYRIPGAAWKHRFDEPLESVGKPGRPGNLLSLLPMLPMIVRMMNYARKRRANGFDPINIGNAPAPGPYQGVPLGGIGSGSIGRGWRGDFRRWQLRSGAIQNQPVYADQFSLFVQQADQPGMAKVLFPGEPADGTLAAWQWELQNDQGRYEALFPRAWTTYTDPFPGIQLTCRQLSPVIAGNYRESSYPVAEFRWQIENQRDAPVRVGLMFTFQNGMGAANDRAGGHTNQPFELDGYPGLLLRHAYRQQQLFNPEGLPQEHSEPQTYSDPLSFALAAHAPGGEVSYCARFTSSGDGAELWEDFAADGRLENQADATPSAAGEAIAGALAVTVELAPGERREVAFSLAWDMPIFRAGYGTPYARRYTRFYGCEGSAAPRMAVDALRQADQWEAQVIAWQADYLKDERMPEWYWRALFNELYYLVDGGTLWVDPQEGPANDVEMGHFAYLEGHEYRMYNTYDVHFYASFALAQLWPRLELALQRDIAAATLLEYPEQMTELYSGKRVPRKLAGAVPHDLGWPDEDPWRKVNGYFLHNVNQWKDLNPKFVLQVYRDYVATGDVKFVCDVWPAVAAAIQHVSRFDQDADGLIENSGSPDQTYDMWPVRGPSAYTAGLWLACLAAGAALAEIAGEPQQAEQYRQMLERGKLAYEEKLWNGRYFNYDSSRSRQHDSIMADQLAGQWYARACGLGNIAQPAYVRSALLTIYDWNVMRFKGGSQGPVNGMRPDGSVDRTSLQSQEVWAGVGYALAATLIQENLFEPGLATAWGVYRQTYEQSGYWFQTPEAWDEHGNYRAIAYMRPLAVWAMQWALERAGTAAEDHTGAKKIPAVPQAGPAPEPLTGGKRNGAARKQPVENQPDQERGV